MEKELFGLRDKDGKEYKVVVSHPLWTNGKLEIDDIVLIEPVKKVDPLPEFKVGMWIIGINEYNPDTPALITRLDGSRSGWYDNFIDGEKYNVFGNFGEAYCRLATPQEIEAHLRKICDEKYLGKKARCLMDEKKYLIDKFWEYQEDTDRLCYHTIDAGGVGIWVYQQGKFATIIPDKKKLPKTKEELQSVLYDYLECPETLSDFLKQYED